MYFLGMTMARNIHTLILLKYKCIICIFVCLFYVQSQNMWFKLIRMPLIYLKYLMSMVCLCDILRPLLSRNRINRLSDLQK